MINLGRERKGAEEREGEGARASRKVRNQTKNKNKSLYSQIHKLNYLEETAEA